MNKRAALNRHRPTRIPNPRILKPPAEVELWAGSLIVRLRFNNQETAREFLLSAIQSDSVTAANLFIKGKFAGARDGAAS